jgi:hypothetical protein
MREHFLDKGLQIDRNRIGHRRHPVPIHDRALEIVGPDLAVRMPARQHFVQDHAQRPVLGASADPPAQQTLRRRVFAAREGIGVAGARGLALGHDAEVDDADAVVRSDQDVLGLEIGVEEIQRVSAPQKIRDAGRDAHAPDRRQRPFENQRRERLALDQFHRHPVRRARDAVVEDFGNQVLVELRELPLVLRALAFRANLRRALIERHLLDREPAAVLPGPAPVHTPELPVADRVSEIDGVVREIHDD